MTIGIKLKELRLNKGESLQKVADAVGVSKPHVWELERGTSKNPSVNLIKKLADHFGQTVDYFISNDDVSDAKKSFARKVNSMNLSDKDIAVLEAAAEALSKEEE